MKKYSLVIPLLLFFLLLAGGVEAALSDGLISAFGGASTASCAENWVSGNTNLSAQGTAACSATSKVSSGSSIELFASNTNYFESASTPTNLPTGAAARTVCYWLNPDTVTGYHHITNYGTGPTNNAYGLYTDGTTPTFYGYSSDQAFASSTLSIGSWAHICYSYTGSQVNMYFNGTNKNNVSKALTTASSALRFGVDAAVAATNLGDGKVDLYKLWNRTLTQAEIIEDYNSGSGCDYSCVYSAAPVTTPYAHIRLLDSYDNSTISGVTVFLGTESNVTDGSGIAYFYNHTTGLNYSISSPSELFYGTTGTATENATTDVYLIRTPYIILNISDMYDNASIAGVTATIGTKTNTSNAAGLLTIVNVSTYSYTLTSTNYFNLSGTATANTTTNVQLYGAFPSITAYNIESAVINTFNITTGVQSNTTTTGALNLLLPPNSTTAINTTAPNYYLFSSNITTGSQDTAAQNVTGLYQTIVTVNATNAYSGALLSNFTGWLYNNDTGFNQSFNTSGNNSILYGIYSNYTAYIDVYGYEIGANNFKTVLFSTNTATITFNLYSQNSIFISIFNEETSAAVTDNVTVTVSGNASEEIYYTTTSNLFLENLTDGNYSLKFNSDNFTQRTYAVTVADRSAQTLNAYLSPGTDTVTFNILDYDSSTNIEGAAILQQRLLNSTWTTVESKSTDITGRAQFSYTIGVKYRFTVTATGYDTKVFELDPIIFTSYVIRLEKNLAVDEDIGLFDVTITYYPKSLVNEENNSFTLTFGSVGGSLESYGYTLAYPGGSLSGGGISANGETFLNSSFLITGATYGSMANLTYWYDSTLGDNSSFNYELLIQGAANDNTAAKLKTNDYGLGILDKLLIATVLVILVAGVLTLFGNVVIGLAGGALVMGYFVFIGFISVWVALPSFLVGLVIIMGRGST